MQRQLIGALRDGGDVEQIRPALAPEYVVELSKYLHPSEAEWLLGSVRMPTDVARRVRRAAAAFYEHYQPSSGRKPDFSLETAVRALVELFEASLGHRLKIAGNKNNGLGRPTPRCAGSRAIEMLLTGIDTAVTTTAVMNMIAKVRRQPEATMDHLDVLLCSNPIGELDSSLLPDREDSIRRLHDDPINGFA